jgi:hypothetical protein
LLTGGALYGLAAISVRTSMRVTAITTPSDDGDCAGWDLFNWGGGSCRPRGERP